MSKVIEEGVPVLAGAVEPSAEKLKFRAPVLGDHVVCLHQRWAYFMATIDSFDEATMTYTVTWDDGDPTGREQSYKVCIFLSSAITKGCVFSVFSVCVIGRKLQWNYINFRISFT